MTPFAGSGIKYTMEDAGSSDHQQLASQAFGKVDWSRSLVSVEIDLTRPHVDFLEPCIVEMGQRFWDNRNSNLIRIRFAKHGV